MLHRTAKKRLTLQPITIREKSVGNTWKGLIFTWLKIIPYSHGNTQKVCY